MANNGIIHAHSTFSYDGEHTLEDLVTRAKRRGFAFVAMTEHSDELDADRMQRFVRECQRLSDPRFLVIPGVEFTCPDDIHILGLGIDALTDCRDPIAVARFIRQRGGVSIIAHPSRLRYTVPKALVVEVDGIEIWNARYDGWLVPNDRAIALCGELRKENRSLVAVAGQDLHEMRSRGYVWIVVPNGELSQAALLRALKEGGFAIANPWVTLHPAALGTPLRLVSIAVARRAYLCARAVGRPIRNGFRMLRGARKPATTRPEGQEVRQGVSRR